MKSLQAIHNLIELKSNGKCIQLVVGLIIFTSEANQSIIIPSSYFKTAKICNIILTVFL